MKKFICATLVGLLQILVAQPGSAAKGKINIHIDNADVMELFRTNMGSLISVRHNKACRELLDLQIGTRQDKSSTVLFYIKCTLPKYRRLEGGPKVLAETREVIIEVDEVEKTIDYHASVTGTWGKESTPEFSRRLQETEFSGLDSVGSASDQRCAPGTSVRCGIDPAYARVYAAKIEGDLIIMESYNTEILQEALNLLFDAREPLPEFLPPGFIHRLLESRIADSASSLNEKGLSDLRAYLESVGLETTQIQSRFAELEKIKEDEILANEVSEAYSRAEKMDTLEAYQAFLDEFDNDQIRSVKQAASYIAKAQNAKQEEMAFSPLYQVTKSRKLTKVEKYISQGWNPHGKQHNGYTAWRYACSFGDAPLVAVFIRAGVDINHVNTLGEGCLHWSASENKADIVHLLIYSGADLNAKSVPMGFTALDIARRKGNSEIRATLQKAGSTVGNPLSDQAMILGMQMYGIGKLIGKAKEAWGSSGSSDDINVTLAFSLFEKSMSGNYSMKFNSGSEWIDRDSLNIAPDGSGVIEEILRRGQTWDVYLLDPGEELVLERPDFSIDTGLCKDRDMTLYITPDSIQAARCD